MGNIITEWGTCICIREGKPKSLYSIRREPARRQEITAYPAFLQCIVVSLYKFNFLKLYEKMVIKKINENHEIQYDSTVMFIFSETDGKMEGEVKTERKRHLAVWKTNLIPKVTCIFVCRTLISIKPPSFNASISF